MTGCQCAGQPLTQVEAGAGESRAGPIAVLPLILINDSMALAPLCDLLMNIKIVNAIRNSNARAPLEFLIYTICARYLMPLADPF
jgi:hypothetical protein